MNTKRMVLCADDYGQNPQISEGILELAVDKRLGAVSCMCVSAHWPRAAGQLKAAAPDVDIGLHFTLTATGPVDPEAEDTVATSSHRALIINSYLRRLDKQAVLKALHTQLDLFEKHLGRLPDFIDGHQHIHMLPVVRKALLEVCTTRLGGHRFYVRSLAHISGRQYAFVKSGIIQALGAGALQRGLERHAIAHNPAFSGIYNFDRRDYRECMRNWLASADSGTLFMCHPGHVSEDIDDPIRNSRAIEYSYLAGDLFLADCRELNVCLVRGQQAYGQGC